MSPDHFIELARPVPGDAHAQQKQQTAINLALFSVVAAATTWLAMRGAVHVPLDLPDPLTFAIEFASYVLAFDVYFYALHRLLHTRAAFRRVHSVHHRVRDVDLWSTIAMHPLEFLLIAGFLPVAMWLAPAHLVSVAAVGIFLGGSIALAHSGREVVPRRLERIPLLGLYLTPRIHAAHHAQLRCNYGATITVLDRLFGTLRA